MEITRFEVAGLQCLEVSPATDQPLPLVVIMHGRGDWGESYADIAPALSATDYRYVFPTAPLPLPGAMFEWFRFEATNIGPAAASARPNVTKLLEELQTRYNTPAERTVLGGFSQGGMMTLEAGLRYPQKLAGLVALSSFLVADAAFNWNSSYRPADYYGQDTNLKEMLATAKTVQTSPIFIGHGSHDPVVPVLAGRATRDLLEENGFSVEYYEFRGAHEITLDELNKLRAFLGRVFASA